MTATPLRRLGPPLVLLALCGGCCPLAQYLCGPDRSRWISESFESHRACVETFLEAVRRDDEKTVYRCLADAFKQRNGIYGMVEASLAWDKLQSAQPGLHLLGSATLRGWRFLDEGRTLVRHDLEAYGRRFQLDVVRQAFVSVTYADDRPPESSGEYVDSLRKYILVQTVSEQTQVTLSFPRPDLPEDLTPEQIDRVSAGHEWKIADLRQIDD